MIAPGQVYKSVDVDADDTWYFLVITGKDSRGVYNVLYVSEDLVEFTYEGVEYLREPHMYARIA